MTAISFYERLWTPLYFFRRGEAYGRRKCQRELESRKAEAMKVVLDLRRARISWEETWVKLAAADEQVAIQQETIGTLEQVVWQLGERLAVAQEQVGALDELVERMLEPGEAGLAVGRMYLQRRWAARVMEREREEELRADAAAAVVKPAVERAREAALTAEMGA
jgi:uncharacterized coiled-coil protein SlyX